jgi:hypothetical protein
MLLNPALNARQRSLRRRLTAYIDVAVVRVSAEAVPALLQLFVERIQKFRLVPPL